jgi:hypothetical protein
VAHMLLPTGADEGASALGELLGAFNVQLGFFFFFFL